MQPLKTDLQGTTSDTSPAQQTDEATHGFCSENPLNLELLGLLPLLIAHYCILLYYREHHLP